MLKINLSQIVYVIMATDFKGRFCYIVLHEPISVFNVSVYSEFSAGKYRTAW